MSDVDSDMEDVEGLIGSPTPDEDTTARLRQFRERMIRETKGKKWSEEVEKMNRALEREGIHNPIIEIFSPRISPILPSIIAAPSHF